MYPILILREEIACLIILLALWLNGRLYQMGKDHASFVRLCSYASGHVLFDIITVITVNRPELVPGWVNFAAHLVFYLFAILFAREFFCYVTELCFQKQTVKWVRPWSLAPLAVYLLLLPLLPIEYLTGDGTRYSYGPAAFGGYALAMIFFLGSAAILALRRKILAPHVRVALIPMLGCMVAAECLQIAVPELLFTGGAVTIITVGFFFSLENPAHVFRQKLLVDALTGVKSRQSYELDIKRMEAEYRRDPGVCYGLVICDINNLKAVNDTLGHQEGDAYIGQIAQLLMQDLKGAQGVYRMGGDEFLAVYRNRPEPDILREVEALHRDCSALSTGHRYPLSVATGCAMSGGQFTTVADVLRTADYLMYKNKAEMKCSFISEDGKRLNISGLTDRIFDAFSATGERSYLTLCNMSTNVSRWSRSAVDYFGLPDEFIYDCISVWMDYIHPDDRADYWADINDVFSGAKKYHDLEYRVRNRAGEYVMCTCRGTILKGKNGQPDMFAATLVNHGIAESIDPVTGLHTEEDMVLYLEDRIAKGARETFLTVSLFTFGRINLLYGYGNGNAVLRQFSDILKRAAGERGQVFRQDGTRFLLCLPDVGARETEEICRSIQDAARSQISLGSLAIPLRVAAGAFMLDAGFRGDSTSVRNDLTYAHDLSKHGRHGKLTFYGGPVQETEEDGRELLIRIHQDAVAGRAGFFLKYQPIIRMDTGRVAGAEALLRWQDERFGEVPPDQFIPWLENDPCFFQLGRWILEQALTDARQVLPLCPDFVINVNVTVLQLEDERFDEMVLDVLKETGFPADRLCLELTERSRQLDLDFLTAQADFFHAQGIQLAMDDVGTGSSSFGVLLRMPVDEVKLDKAFITDVRARKVNQVFVSSIVGAARSMGYKSCLEGVEDRETFEYLQQYGAEFCQGYYFSRPLPIGEFLDYASGSISSDPGGSK